MTGKIEITLKSDLCAGSGYAYAGVVDSDTCYDDYGLPYIPARRLKGCLREAALLIEKKEDVDRLFGEWGQDTLKHKTLVVIDNAYLPEREELINACKAEKKLLTRERVLNQFTRMKAQTRIAENGVAQPASLRFTRIVNHYDPLDENVNQGEDKKELKFYARVEFEDGDKDKLENIVKALRHIGYDRNRGLGNVRCKLVQDTSPMSQTKVQQDKGILRYLIRTAAPLALSQSNADDTEKYISGQNVLGYFASQYLKKNGADERFEELFLKNKVCFSPLYPSDEKGTVYFPVPAYIKMLKKSKKLVNVSRKEPDKKDKDYAKQVPSEKYSPENGNQPKKLTGKFVTITEAGEVDIREVQTQLIYHHRHRNDEDKQKEQLYALEAIKEGQYFAGTITGNAKDLNEIAEILEKKGTMAFGKSRSAQYGLCTVEKLDSQEFPEAARPEVLKKEDSILVILHSDAIFLDEQTAGYTVDTNKVREQLVQSLMKAGIVVYTDEEYKEKRKEEYKEKRKKDEALEELYTEIEVLEELYTEIEVKELHGHYSAWNLRRQSIPCVCAGSTFEFKLKENQSISVDKEKMKTGIRWGEGYGNYTVTVKKDDWGLTAASANKNCSKSKETGDKLLCRKVAYSELKQELQGKAFNSEELKKANIAMNASEIGRLTLMLQESRFKKKQEGMEEETVADLKDRIKSIKRDNFKKNANELVKKYYDEALKNLGKESQEYLSKFFTEKNSSKEQNEEEQKKTDKQREKLKLFCMEQALVALKYQKKGENPNEQAD